MNNIGCKMIGRFIKNGKFWLKIRGVKVSNVNL